MTVPIWGSYFTFLKKGKYICESRIASSVGTNDFQASSATDSSRESASV